MSKNILGIDLGTSSVKLLLRQSNGQLIKSKAKYSSQSPQGFLDAVKEASKNLDLSALDAIGLSSQVGTYIVNNKDVISWNSPVGKDELSEIKSKFSRKTFINEISMPHPDIISYHIPRLLYIKRNFKNIKSICQPKDYLCLALTGNCVTDKFSCRGIAHMQNCSYSRFFLDYIGIDKSVLPEIINPEEFAGYTTKSCADILGLPSGVPVFAGLNDFFASLSGMEISNTGDMFDITGTSEHIGIISDSLSPDTSLVSGPYFEKFVHYGVTASSGASLDFGLREFGLDDISLDQILKNSPPVFTPYVNGERAPIYDANAKGVFFGINSDCTKKELGYAVLEGVAFSIYHIYETMGAPTSDSITVSGGSSKNMLLNTIKAELFNKNILLLKENDTSALGAVKAAAKGMGIADSINSIQECIKPRGKYTQLLLKRYNIYKKIHSSLKDEFVNWKGIDN